MEAVKEIGEDAHTISEKKRKPEQWRSVDK